MRRKERNEKNFEEIYVNNPITTNTERGRKKEKLVNKGRSMSTFVTNKDINKISRRKWGSLIHSISAIPEVQEDEQTPKKMKNVQFNNPMIEELVQKMESRQAKFQKKWTENKQKLLKDKEEHYSFHPNILKSKKKRDGSFDLSEEEETHDIRNYRTA